MCEDVNLPLRSYQKVLVALLHDIYQLMIILRKRLHGVRLRCMQPLAAAKQQPTEPSLRQPRSLFRSLLQPALCSACSCNLPFALPALAARPLLCHGRLVGLGSVGRCFAAALFSKNWRKACCASLFSLSLSQIKAKRLWMKRHEDERGCSQERRRNRCRVGWKVTTTSPAAST